MFIAICVFLFITSCGENGESADKVASNTSIPTSEVIILQTTTPAPTPMPTPTPTAEPTPTPDGLCGGRYPDKFSDDGGEMTDVSYKSKNISFEVRSVSDTETYSNLVAYFVVDIYVQDVTSIKTAAARDDFTKNYTGHVEDIAVDHNAILAISGDYYCFHKQGIVIRNGELYRKTPHEGEDICVLYRDGTMETYLSGGYSLDAIMERDPWQAWSFGPALLDQDGNVKTKFNSSLGGGNPRCAIGYYEPGHYCFIVVDGRREGYSEGLKLSDLSQLAYDLGCTAAYNLDGGGSARLFWNGAIYNNPTSSSRVVSDIIYIQAEG